MPETTPQTFDEMSDADVRQALQRAYFGQAVEPRQWLAAPLGRILNQHASALGLAATYQPDHVYLVGLEMVLGLGPDPRLAASATEGR